MSGYLFLRTASCSVVFQPFMKKSFRYVGWEDGDVDIAFFEQVFHHLLLGVALILLERPHVVSRAEVLVVVVETLDPALGIAVLLVGWTAVPEVHVAVDDEDLLSIRGAIHSGPSLSSGV